MTIGYIFTFLNYICYCLSRFSKEKKNIFILDIIAKIFTIIALYFLGSLSGAYSFIISFITIIFCNIKERKQFPKYIDKIFFIIFEIGYLIVLICTFSGVSSILIFITSTVTLFANWFLPSQKMRLVGIPNSIIYLSYQISIKNLIGLLEIFVIVSNIVSYLHYKKGGNKNELS